MGFVNLAILIVLSANLNTCDAVRGVDTDYFRGCFWDNANNRVMADLLFCPKSSPVNQQCINDCSLGQPYCQSNNRMTLDLCRDICVAQNFRFYALQAGRQCFCGGAFSDYDIEGQALGCDSPCTGNMTQSCGGEYRMSVYEIPVPIIGSACFHPGYVDNGGDISPIDPEFPGDSVLSYFDACPEGYIQEGASALYCQLTGGWNTSLPTCIRRCFDPPVPMFGEIRIGGPKPIYLSGDSFLYICTIDSGSAFASYYNLRCNEDGEWTGNGLNIVCPDPTVTTPPPTTTKATTTQATSTQARTTPSSTTKLPTTVRETTTLVPTTTTREAPDTTLMTTITTSMTTPSTSDISSTRTSQASTMKPSDDTTVRVVSTSQTQDPSTTVSPSTGTPARSTDAAAMTTNSTTKIASTQAVHSTTVTETPTITQTQPLETSSTVDSTTITTRATTETVSSSTSASTQVDDGTTVVTTIGPSTVLQSSSTPSTTDRITSRVPSTPSTTDKMTSSVPTVKRSTVDDVATQTASRTSRLPTSSPTTAVYDYTRSDTTANQSSENIRQPIATDVPTVTNGMPPPTTRPLPMLPRLTKRPDIGGLDVVRSLLPYLLVAVALCIFVIIMTVVAFYSCSRRNQEEKKVRGRTNAQISGRGNGHANGILNVGANGHTTPVNNNNFSNPSYKEGGSAFDNHAYRDELLDICGNTTTRTGYAPPATPPSNYDTIDLEKKRLASAGSPIAIGGEPSTPTLPPPLPPLPSSSPPTLPRRHNTPPTARRLPPLGDVPRGSYTLPKPSNDRAKGEASAEEKMHKAPLTPPATLPKPVRRTSSVHKEPMASTPKNTVSHSELYAAINKKPKLKRTHAVPLPIPAGDLNTLDSSYLSVNGYSTLDSRHENRGSAISRSDTLRSTASEQFFDDETKQLATRL